MVATYYFAFRSQTLAKAVEEISYHATSGIKHPPKGSLLEQCSARQAGVDAFDATGRIGLLHVAFPLKMMRHPDGHVTSCDLLHTVAGAVIFDMYENQDARLISIWASPTRCCRPSPARPTGRSASGRGRVSPSISPPSARSSSRRPGSRPTTSRGWSRRSRAARS